MQIIKSFIKLLVFICPFYAGAQSTFLPQGDKGYQLIDRLEIKQQTNTDLNFSTLKPFNRRYIVQEAELLDSIHKASALSPTETSGNHLTLTRVDEYNMNSFLMNNTEWVTGSKESFASRKPILASLYKTKTNLIEVNKKDFFLAINPILQLHAGKESGNSDMIYLNTRGISARGMISRRIGFFTSITDNQERGPKFFQQKVIDLRGGTRSGVL